MTEIEKADYLYNEGLKDNRELLFCADFLSEHIKRTLNDDTTLSKDQLIAVYQTAAIMLSAQRLEDVLDVLYKMPFIE